jgi:hypothetical protein
VKKGEEEGEHGDIAIILFIGGGGRLRYQDTLASRPLINVDMRIMMVLVP